MLCLAAHRLEIELALKRKSAIIAELKADGERDVKQEDAFKVAGRKSVFN
jgi:hypothetical protein